MKNSTRKTLAPASLMATLSPENVDELIAFHRATFGDARMDATGTTPPEKPEGVTDEEWNALGDPGKAAIVREREARTTAERELAAARAASTARPGPPASPATATAQTQQQPGHQQATTATGEGDKGKGGELDIAAIVQQAVAAAVTPLQQRLDGYEAGQAANRITEAVTAAAAPQFYDPTDVLAQVDLTTLTDGQGGPDAAKITAALEDLAKTKPHLVKPFDAARRPAPGTPIGATGPAPVSIDDQVKARLAKMQQTTGIKLAPAPGAATA